MKKDIIRLPLVLLIICGIVTAILAYANQITSPIIANREVQTINESRLAVLPKADEFEKMDYQNEYVSEIMKAKNNAGYCVSTTVKGYGGDIKMIVGISENFTVTGVRITSMSETPGLGVKANDEAWLSQYIGGSDFEVVKGGKSGSDDAKSSATSETETKPEAKTAAKGEKTTIDAVTAATISSKAITKGVTESVMAAKEAAGDE